MNRINLAEIQNKVQQEIEKILVHTGIYYRIFGRVKTSRSLYNKIMTGKYTNGRLIQDVIGIRIVLYFSEDLKIVHELLDDAYGEGEYTESQNGPQTFGPAKRNGVYPLPKEVQMAFRESVPDTPVDTTFEVQLRTVSFEGWHEIEHDMRYKMRRNDDQTMLIEDQELSRMLNSVLASYELNDWAMIRIFNEMSAIYLHSKRWEEMLRTRFRIKINERPMNRHLVEVLDQLPKEDLLAMYNCERKDLIISLRHLIQTNRCFITYNAIILVLNRITCKNEMIENHFKKYPLVARPLRVANLRPLEDRIVYDGNWNEKWDESQVDKAAEFLYDWCIFKAASVFRNMPDCKEAINDRLHMSVPGYKLKFKYDKHSVHMFLKHPDMGRPATIWMISADYEDGEFKAATRYYSPDNAVDITHFSEPLFVKELRKAGLLSGDEIVVAD